MSSCGVPRDLFTGAAGGIAFWVNQHEALHSGMVIGVLSYDMVFRGHCIFYG